MAKPSEIQHQELRALLTEARGRYLDGKYRESVDKSVETAQALLRLRPELQVPHPSMEAVGWPFSTSARNIWPQLGVKLIVAPNQPPAVVWDRQEFSHAEAVTYYEFISDTIAVMKL